MHLFCMWEIIEMLPLLPQKHWGLSLTKSMHIVEKVFVFNVSYNYTVSPGRDREFGNLLA